MRKEILDALTAKFPGVPAAILGRIADKLAKTANTEEEVKAAVEAVTIQSLIESYGDSRATEAANTARDNAVKDYEKRHGLKDGKPAGTAEVPPTEQKGAKGGTKPEDDAPAWAKTLIGRIDALETRQVAESRHKRLSDLTARLPESLRKAYGRTPVDGCSDDEFETLLAEVKGEVDAIAKESAAKGSVTGRPLKNQGAAAAEELTQAQRESIAHREGKPAEGKQAF